MQGCYQNLLNAFVAVENAYPQCPPFVQTLAKDINDLKTKLDDGSIREANYGTLNADNTDYIQTQAKITAANAVIKYCMDNPNRCDHDAYENALLDLKLQTPHLQDLQTKMESLGVDPSDRNAFNNFISNTADVYNNIINDMNDIKNTILNNQPS